MDQDPRAFANQVIEECDSTNTLGKRLAEAGFPHGTWVSSRVQTQGRGRLGRQWKGLEGNLFFSMVVRGEILKNLSWIPLTTAVACVESILELNPKAPVRIKWPNDLWLQSAQGFAKCGGILCEGAGGAGDSYVVIGIGINCAQAPEGLDQPTATLDLSADRLREVLVGKLLKLLNEVSGNGPASVSQVFNKFSMLPIGSEVDWQDGARSGKVLGLGSSGELRVWSGEHDGGGGELSLFAEDVKIKIRKT